MDLNLDTLKREVLEYLEAGGFGIFRSSPGTLEGLPMVLWDAENHPDYQMFLEAAQKTGTKLVLFASREFDTSDIDDLVEQLEDGEFDRDEKRDYQSRLRELRIFEGVTCSIELAFDYSARLYVYQVQPDWYEEFLNIEDEIASRLIDEDESSDEDDSLGGFFSKN